MGITYKLTQEVVDFIMAQRTNNPKAYCRELAELVAQTFNVQVSKSSVHDILKEANIVSARGRKPKDKFKIPTQKKAQILASLPPPPVQPVEPPPELASMAISPEPALVPVVEPANEPEEVVEQAPRLLPDLLAVKEVVPETKPQEPPPDPLIEGEIEERMGEIFIKAALWDLGVYDATQLTPADWVYYLTYAAGIKVFLEDGSAFLIQSSLPLQRAIAEAVDGVVTGKTTLIVDRVSDEGLLKEAMAAQPGKRIQKIAIVDENDHNIAEFSTIMEYNRNFIAKKRVYVVCDEKELRIRASKLFFTQNTENSDVMEDILSLKGFITQNSQKYCVTLVIEDGYKNQSALEAAIHQANLFFLRDEQNRLLEIACKVVEKSQS